MSASSHSVLQPPTTYNPDEPFSLKNRYPDAAFFLVDTNVYLRFSGRQIANQETCVLEFTDSENIFTFLTIQKPDNLTVWACDGSLEELLEPGIDDDFYIIDLSSNIKVYNSQTRAVQTFRAPWKASVDLSMEAALLNGKPILTEKQFIKALRELYPLRDNIQDDIDLTQNPDNFDENYPD